MSHTLSGAVKTAAMQYIENAKLCDLRFGSVVSIKPLKVKISSVLTLPSSVLIVPQHLKDYKVNMSDSSGTKTITIKNALKVGDKVALIRSTGGQSYYILDRI